MKIALVTRNASPHTGGTARLVCGAEKALKRRGHDVIIIAPDTLQATESDAVVALTRDSNSSDMHSGDLRDRQMSDLMNEFQPELIHSHYPAIAGDLALRFAVEHKRPLVFTNHDVLELCQGDDTHQSDLYSQLTMAYCNLSTHVVAPSSTIELMLRNLGVIVPITVIPTGIDLEFFSDGDGPAFRKNQAIERDAIVIGYVGRLADEKNLHFLAHAVGLYLHEHPTALFLVVGAGAETAAMLEILTQLGIRDRVALTGHLSDQTLVDAYAAMDVFAFASQAESEAFVVIEAMASGCPVVGLDGPGVRDIVDERNGRLLNADASYEEFSAAIAELTKDSNRLWRIGEAARETVHGYGLESCTDKLLSLYETVLANFHVSAEVNISELEHLHETFKQFQFVQKGYYLS